MPEISLPPELRHSALHWLAERDAHMKLSGVRQLKLDWDAGRLELDTGSTLDSSLPIPGCPAKPELVSPRDVPHRPVSRPEGRAAMIHAMTHIEFNAINLALDAVWRFPGMPREYYADWLRVADEEALHFDLLSEHLKTLGYAYGSFPAHNGLWGMAVKTQHDLLARMALLPRTMEARGLDVTPGMKSKLVQAGDMKIAPIMDVILRDEIGHVAIGNRWFNFLCAQRGLDPAKIYAQLTAEFNIPSLRRPLNLEARRAAGFSEKELLAMEAQPP